MLRIPRDNFKVEKLKTVKRHTSNVYSVLCFVGEPYNRILSASDDRKIVIWNSKTFECLNIISSHNLYVIHLVKWRENVFLSASYDSTVKSFSLLSEEPHFRMEKDFKLFNRNVYKLMKISDDLFLAVCESSRLYIVSYSQNKIMKEFSHSNNDILESLNTNWFSTPIRSINHLGCFFLNFRKILQGKFTGHVLLLNFETIKVEKKFTQIRSEARRMCVFKNSEEKEILACCCDSKEVIFYATQQVVYDKIIKTVDIGHDAHVILYLNSLSQQYIFVGDDIGGISLIHMDLDCINDSKLLYKKKSAIGDTFLDAKVFSQNKNEVLIVGGGVDQKLTLLKLSGFTFDPIPDTDRQDLLDLRERMDYLGCFEDILGDKIQEFSSEIMISENFSLRVFKSFF